MPVYPIGLGGYPLEKRQKYFDKVSLERKQQGLSHCLSDDANKCTKCPFMHNPIHICEWQLLFRQKPHLWIVDDDKIQLCPEEDKL